ncbi:MAG: class I SAM-dependent methyltransferase [Pseudomonadota bacterium]
MSALYDSIGKSYNFSRRTDPRLAAVLHDRLGHAEAILNIGAGAGSYEPDDRSVVAAEPSATMLAQRSDDAAPAVQAVAERLPFASNSFDAAMAVLTIHHWSDWRLGIGEALRVAQGRLALLTWTGFPAGFWLLDYFPEIEAVDAPVFPTIEELASCMGKVTVDLLPIPADCLDGMLCAYWQRPEFYLDSKVRQGMSIFSKLDQVEARISQLAEDLNSGEWHRRNSDLLAQDTADYGYRVVSCGL